MLHEKQIDSYIGITIGFFIGLSILQGFEALIERIESLANSSSMHGSSNHSKHGSQIEMKTYPAGYLADEESAIMTSTREYPDWSVLNFVLVFILRNFHE